MKSKLNDQPESLPHKHHRIGLILFVLSLLLLFSLGHIRNPLKTHHFYGFNVDIPAPSFNLNDLDDQQRQLDDFQGKYVFLMFGYLNCTQTCQSQALVMNALSQKILDDNVHFVYISMDPVRDTTTRLRNYFYTAKDNLTVLKGNNIKQLQSIANKYNAPFSIKKVNDNDYEIVHPGFIYLINPQSQLALIYPSTIVDVSRLQEDLMQYQSQRS